MATSTTSYHTARATVWARYRKLIPFSIISNVLGKWALPITATPKYLKPLTKITARIAPVLPTRLTIFRRCYDGKRAYFIWSRESVFYYVSLNQIPSRRRQLCAESFFWGILRRLCNYQLVQYLASTGWWANATGLQLWHFQRVSACQCSLMLWHRIFRHFKQKRVPAQTYGPLDPVHHGFSVKRYTERTPSHSLYKEAGEMLMHSVLLVLDSLLPPCLQCIDCHQQRFNLSHWLLCWPNQSRNILCGTHIPLF